MDAIFLHRHSSYCFGVGNLFHLEKMTRIIIFIFSVGFLLSGSTVSWSKIITLKKCSYAQNSKGDYKLAEQEYQWHSYYEFREYTIDTDKKIIKYAEKVSDKDWRNLSVSDKNKLSQFASKEWIINLDSNDYINGEEIFRDRTGYIFMIDKIEINLKRKLITKYSTFPGRELDKIIFWELCK